MLIKLNILNMIKFLQSVNVCKSAVYLIYPDGRRANINKQYDIQNELLEEYCKNERFLKLSLDVPDKKDYMDLVLSFIGCR